uniref:WGS project CAEQ00000000 data, annotated contig 1842 n=1 Tax=Trypanosoma congolense (strain IL3000) TaxID=1068625 RepID=F9W9A7_TRYCI|nr:unnamed protein product [Trypanosoma congolense IL3000]
MFSRCGASRCLVHYRSLASAVEKLNDMLDVRHGRELTPRDTIKQHLRTEVMPLLKGTKIDRRHNSAMFRRSMSQLVRDAAFAAVVLGVSPTGPYVNQLVECIKHDHERMQFTSQMTSSQASRIMVHLCQVGVRDGAVLVPLVARLDFSQLKEISRVMFALAEEGMCNEVVLLIVPMYCGERWALTYDGGNGCGNLENKNCNVFEAVRILRVLSKSVRSVVEQRRIEGSAQESYTPLPVESIQRLRANLVAFVLDNADVLRGAHWANFTRSMVHFPLEFKTVKYMGDYPSVLQAVGELRRNVVKAGQGLDGEVDTLDLAALGMARLFAGVEQVQELPSGPATERKRIRGTIDDVAPGDLSKIITVLEDVPAPSGVKEQRLALVVKIIVSQMDSMTFTDIIRFLHALRNIEGSAEFFPSLQAIVEVVSKRLMDAARNQEGKQHRAQVPYTRLIQLATLISAFRVKSCKGFTVYLSHILPSVQLFKLDDATSLMNALAAIGPKDGQEFCAKVGGEIMHRVASSNGDEDNGALLLLYPVSCVKLLRASVLLHAVPSNEFIIRIFGDARSQQEFPGTFTLEEASAVFDISRSLYHFSRMKVEDTEWKEVLWSRGFVGFLLPLLRHLCSTWYNELVGASGKSRRVSYVPLAWRSTMETLFFLLDVNLDATSLAVMEKRLQEIYPVCRDIVAKAVSIADLQIRSRGSTGEAHPFSSNAVLHVVYLLLMFEHIIYHATWQAEVSGTTQEASVVAERMRAMKKDYNALITTDGGAAQGSGITALELMDRIFPPRGDGANECTKPLIGRSEVMEITTNLPFAISLVMSQGPINECFCERAVALMVSTGD